MTSDFPSRVTIHGTVRVSYLCIRSKTKYSIFIQSRATSNISALIGPLQASNAKRQAFLRIGFKLFLVGSPSSSDPLQASNAARCDYSANSSTAFKSFSFCRYICRRPGWCKIQDELKSPAGTEQVQYYHSITITTQIKVCNSVLI